ncbi:MAG: PAS domain S-box protein [Rubrobacteraceae bacterium]
MEDNPGCRGPEADDLGREEAFGFLVRHALDMVMLLDAEGRILYVSPASERWLGYSPEDLRGRVSFEYIHPDDREHAVTSFSSLLVETELESPMDLRLCHRDGSWRDFEIVGRSLLENPTVGGVVVNVRNVTERKRVEEKLRETEERYRSLVENIPAVIYLDNVGEYSPAAYMSPDVEQVLGYKAEEFISTPGFWRDLLHPEDREWVLAENERACRTGEPLECEYRMIHRDGRTVWVRNEAVLIRDEKGDPLYWQGILIDFTGRRETEEKLKESEVLYRTLVEQIQAVTYVDLADGAYPDLSLYTSPQIEAMTGYMVEEWGVPEKDLWEESLYHEDREWVLAADERARATGQPFSEEYRLLTRDGRVIWVRDEAVLLRDDSDKPWLWQGVLMDITEIKQAQEALKESEERFRSAFEDAATGIALINLDNRYLRVNPALCELLGYEEVELLEKTSFEVTHPEDLEVSRGRSSRMLEADDAGKMRLEKRYVCKDGSVVWAVSDVSLVRDSEGKPSHFISQYQDITERKRLEESLERRAFHDPLTDLPNRSLLMNRLGRTLTRIQRHGGRVAMLFLDLDDFKVVNDSLGHEVGDRLLVMVAERLSNCLRPEDTLSRLGGDEFVVLLESDPDLEEATGVAARILEALKISFDLQGRERFVGASIGITFGGQPQSNRPGNILKEADMAMYRAKEKGKSGYALFEQSMEVQVNERLELEGGLRRAIERGGGEFSLRYQPIVRLHTGEISGIEALLRWNCPGKGAVEPERVIPVAEKSGLIEPLGRWVLGKAFRQARDWRGLHPAGMVPVMCVNLSARQFRTPNLLEEIQTQVAKSGVEPDAFGFEITESTVMEEIPATITTLGSLKELGVKLAIDDFGTGYSSLSSLTRFPVDSLKIDRSFVAGLAQDGSNAEIVISGIISLAHGLGLEVVAEGVETAEQLAVLRRFGCELAQGNFFWEPLTGEDASELLASRAGEVTCTEERAQQ